MARRPKKKSKVKKIIFNKWRSKKKVLKNTVSLEIIKKNKTLQHLLLIKQSRLSVMPIDAKSWKTIYKMSNIK